MRLKSPECAYLPYSRRRFPPELIKLWQNSRLCPHFHLSLQSGSAGVLKRMNRRYSPDEYRKAVQLIRQGSTGGGNYDGRYCRVPGGNGRGVRGKSGILQTDRFCPHPCFFVFAALRHGRRSDGRAGRGQSKKGTLQEDAGAGGQKARKSSGRVSQGKHWMCSGRNRPTTATGRA